MPLHCPCCLSHSRPLAISPSPVSLTLSICPFCYFTRLSDCIPCSPHHIPSLAPLLASLAPVFVGSCLLPPLLLFRSPDARYVRGQAFRVAARRAMAMGASHALLTRTLTVDVGSFCRYHGSLLSFAGFSRLRTGPHASRHWLSITIAYGPVLTLGPPFIFTCLTHPTPLTFLHGPSLLPLKCLFSRPTTTATTLHPLRSFPHASAASRRWHRFA